MWAGLRFVNGYSPIRGAGVGRAFAFYTHGEIDPAMANYLLGYEAGPEGLLKTIGVDGVVIAPGMAVSAPPSPEWELAMNLKEGQVYHRRGEPLATVRAVTSLDTLPNERFGKALITLRENSRDRVTADIRVPSDQPAALLLSRPYFDGYQAAIGNETLSVECYRGLIPIVRVPAGSDGRLTIVYRPRWLLWGGVAMALSALVWAASVWRASRS